MYILAQGKGLSLRAWYGDVSALLRYFPLALAVLNLFTEQTTIRSLEHKDSIGHNRDWPSPSASTSSSRPRRPPCITFGTGTVAHSPAAVKALENTDRIGV